MGVTVESWIDFSFRKKKNKSMSAYTRVGRSNTDSTDDGGEAKARHAGPGTQICGKGRSREGFQCRQRR